LRFWYCERGGAAEFALILPLFILFFVGLIDAGLFFYEVNRGEKATQIGARMAVVTNPVAPGLGTESYVGATVGGVTLTQGDRIPAAALGTITCNNGGCSSFGHDPAAFALLLTRMQQIMPRIQASNLVVEYRGSGLGYAGNPNGMDISPLVTVRLTGLTFAPTMLFGAQLNLPDFAYTLTMEDGQGTGSN
jgi:hypothetical protein